MQLLKEGACETASATSKVPVYQAFCWKQQRYGLQACPNATLVRTTASHAEADDLDAVRSKPVVPLGRVISPWL